MPALWSGVVLLAVIGLAASVGRGFSTLEVLRSGGSLEHSRLDQWSAKGTAIMLGTKRDTSE